MSDVGEHLSLLDTLDGKIADAVERALRARGIAVRRSRVTMTVDGDPRLRQQGTRLEVGAEDEAAARQISDAVTMRRARLLSHPRARRGAESDLGGDAGGTMDLGGYDGGDCGGGDGGCD